MSQVAYAATGRPADSPRLSARERWTWAAIATGLLALLLWSNWTVAYRLFRDWQNDPNYSVGQLVPLAALYLAWHDRKRLAACRIRPSWWGLGLLLFAFYVRFYGLRFMYESIERWSLVLAIAGLVLLIAGWQFFWRAKWILLFLFLMVPLPNRINNRISLPLQRASTDGTVFLLETFGVTVSQDGNVLVLNDNVPVAVAEACSGLRMLTAFVVVAAVMAYIVKRPAWQKVVLLASAVPIAIICNLVRLLATALLFMFTSSATAETFFHDFAGVSMMPLAVFLLIGELWLMDRLVIPDKPAEQRNASGRPPRRAATVKART